MNKNRYAKYHTGKATQDNYKKHQGYHGHCKCGKTFRLHSEGQARKFCVICDADVIIQPCHAGA